MMKNVRMMYLRPGNLFKDFIIEDDTEEVTATGRVVNVHKGDGTNVLKGCMAAASDKDIENHSTEDHRITHTIVQAGRPKAKRNDRLLYGDRRFYIVDIDDVGDLGVTTVYYAEERRDA